MIFSKKKRWNQRHSRLQNLSKRHPFLCVGLPFLTAVVGGSLALLPSQETKYQVRDQKIQNQPIEEITARKGEFNIQEEYFKMTTQGTWNEDWEPKRVERPPEDEPVF